nr:uncharacterized protein LOC111515607 [Leptinotarsa decemlineata]
MIRVKMFRLVLTVSLTLTVICGTPVADLTPKPRSSVSLLAQLLGIAYSSALSGSTSSLGYPVHIYPAQTVNPARGSALSASSSSLGYSEYGYPAQPAHPVYPCTSMCPNSPSSTIQVTGGGPLGYLAQSVYPGHGSALSTSASSLGYSAYEHPAQSARPVNPCPPTGICRDSPSPKIQLTGGGVFRL